MQPAKSIASLHTVTIYAAGVMTFARGTGTITDMKLEHLRSPTRKLLRIAIVVCGVSTTFAVEQESLPSHEFFVGINADLPIISAPKGDNVQPLFSDPSSQYSIRNSFWLTQQWAALSPEQRGQLRQQIREQHQVQREKRRAHSLPIAADSPSGQAEQLRPQQLSPGDRREFHQWMRERRDSGR